MCDRKLVRDHGDMLNTEDTNQFSASDESEPDERPSRAPFDPELDHTDDDDDDRKAEVCAPAVPYTAQSSFSLSGGSSAFSDRSHSIFDRLDSVGQQNGVSTLPPLPSHEADLALSSCPTPPKKRGVPDYLVHPDRWTHYSLEDVTETSDQDNSRAAFHFLSSLQQKRKSESSCDIQQRMIFSSPKRQLKQQPSDQLSAVKRKERAMHLGHLEEEDQDEDGRGREKAGGWRAEQSAEKTVERDKDEEKGMSVAVGQVEEKEHVQKRKEMEEFSPSFTSFKKMKAKNYRRSSGDEDD